MKRTLLVLGAGASKSINHCFPTGFELLQSIHSHLFNDRNDVPQKPGEGEYVSDLTNKIVSIIKKDGLDHEKELKIFKKNLYDYFSAYEVKYLREALTTSISIDDFTNKHINQPLFQTISKYTTAHILKGSEHAFFESTNKKSEHWLSVFLESFSKNIENINNISSCLNVISFNYDRLFAYLFTNYFNKNYQSHISTIASLEKSVIYYPYGSLGSLIEIPFESSNGDMQKMINAYKKFQLLERKPKKWLPNDQFDSIGFIGFAFDRTNFENLNLQKFKDCKVFSSYYNVAEKPHQEKALGSIFKKSNITYFSDPKNLAVEILK